MSVKGGIITDVHVDAAPISGEPESIMWQGDQRWFTNAVQRTTVFGAEMEAQGVDLCVDLGDIVNSTAGGNADAADDLADIVAALTDNYTGDTHLVMGNHEVHLWKEDWTDYIAQVSQTPPGLVTAWTTGKPAGWPITTSYSWDKGGIHFVSFYYGVPLTTDEKAAVLVWLATDLAATDLPIVVFSHYYLDQIAIGSGFDVVQDVLDDYNVQAVITSHMHQVPRLADFITYPIGVDTPFYHLRANCIGPIDSSTPDVTLGKDAACYIFDILPNAVVGTSHPRAKIDVTCYYTPVELDNQVDEMDRETRYAVI